MKCVSYTRATSGMVDTELPTDTIQKQNSTIARYVEVHGWKLQRKYSDRKREHLAATAFQQLKEDGINRRFDLVVAASLYTLGATVFLANDMLRKIFVPLGIQFAIAEDDFYSGEHTTEEIMEYLDEKVKACRGKRLYGEVKKTFARRSQLKFGLAYDDEKNEFQIEESEAAIVREIFEMGSAGIKPAEIAKELNRKNMESPQRQVKRRTGEPIEGTPEYWKPSKVAEIIGNALYIGQWTRNIHNIAVTDPCPAIVSEDVFYLAKSFMEKRTRKSGHAVCASNAFAGLMVDYDTHYPLSYFRMKPTKEPAIRFAYPKPERIFYDAVYIREEECMRQVQAQLEKEHDRAALALQKVTSPSGQAKKTEWQAKLQSEAQELFWQMSDLESADVALQLRTEKEKTEEATDARQHEQNRADFVRLDAELQHCLASIEELNLVFSAENPWIQLFATVDLQGDITQRVAQRLMEQVQVVRFERVVVVPKEQQWREKLPREWFEEEV